MVRRQKANYTIQSVSHALDVLEQFSSEADELGVTELSKRLKLHKNNVFRILATLESRGYIDQNRITENYRLGIRCLRLGQGYLSQNGLRRLAEPVMRALVADCGETAFVAVLHQDRAVVLDACEPERPVRYVPRIGDPTTAPESPAGQVLLAFAEMTATAREEASRRGGAALNHPGATLATVLADGFACDPATGESDERSLAVPVRDYTGAVVAALGVAGPRPRLVEQHLRDVLLPRLQDAARTLSTRLGYDEPATNGIRLSNF